MEKKEKEKEKPGSGSWSSRAPPGLQRLSSAALETTDGRWGARRCTDYLHRTSNKVRAIQHYTHSGWLLQNKNIHNWMRLLLCSCFPIWNCIILQYYWAPWFMNRTSVFGWIGSEINTKWTTHTIGHSWLQWATVVITFYTLPQYTLSLLVIYIYTGLYFHDENATFVHKRMRLAKALSLRKLTLLYGLPSTFLLKENVISGLPVQLDAA